MHKKIRQKRNRKIAWGMALVAVPTLALSGNDHDFEPIDQPVDITVIDDGNIIELENVPAKTISEAVKFYDEDISEQDRIFPGGSDSFFPSGAELHRRLERRRQ